MSDLLQRYQQTASADHGAALALPFEVYRDADVFNLEVDNIYHGDWVFVCSEAELAKPGDYFALTLANESIVVLRGLDGKLRALSNLCRHRGTPLLDEGFGSVGKLIVCPYHAWSYDNSGRLKAAPFVVENEVNKSDHRLPQYHLETTLGLVFVNLSDNPIPLEQRFGGLEGWASVFEPQRFVEATAGSEETWTANWKLAMENAMESYHLFKVHKETLETVTPSKQAYYVAGSSEWTLTGGKMLENEGMLAKWFKGDQPKVYSHYLLISLPPNFVGIMSWDSFGWLCTLPVDANTTIVRAGAQVEAGYGGEDATSREFTEAFFAEDKWICERVHQGMRSTHGKGGRLVEMERPVIDFHQFLASRLFNTTPSPYHENREDNPFLNQG